MARSLHQRLINTRENKNSLFWLAKIKKEIPSEPTVRDVCASCNNVTLSALDGYICELFDRSFVNILNRHERVEFEYDHHRLKRWLLKICFNSARIHSSADIIVFPPLLPYIRGESDVLGRSVQLFCQLSYPAEVPDEFLEPEDERPVIVRPDIHRVGHAWFGWCCHQRTLRLRSRPPAPSLLRVAAVGLCGVHSGAQKGWHGRQ
jgi:hypothetical protein